MTMEIFTPPNNTAGQSTPAARRIEPFYKGQYFNDTFARMLTSPEQGARIPYNGEMMDTGEDLDPDEIQTNALLALAAASPSRPIEVYSGEMMDTGEDLDAAELQTASLVNFNAPRPTRHEEVYEGEMMDTGEDLNESELESTGLVTTQIAANDEGDNDNAESGFFGKDGFGFEDFLDAINPLQHIPILSTIYRELTGDTISPASRLAGGALFGGVFGFAGAVINGVIEAETGKDIGGNVVAFLTGEDIVSPQLAEAPAKVAPATMAPAAPTTSVSRPLRLLPADTSSTTLNTGEIASSRHNPPPRKTADNLPNAVEAVLKARSAVPPAGSIAGLGGFRKTPTYADIRTSANTKPHGVNRATAPMLSREVSLAASTAASTGAEGSAEQARIPGKRGVPPARGTMPSATATRRRAASASIVPNKMVPNAMTNALDKYEMLMKQRAAATPNPGPESDN